MAVSSKWLGKCIGFSLFFLVQKHSCDLSTKEVFRVLNNKINNIQFEVGVYSADNDAVKETLQRIEEQLAHILSKTGGIPQTETSNNHDNTEVPTHVDTASDFDTLVTRVHKTLGEEKKIARDNMQHFIHAFDKYKEETKSEINQYKETIFGELSVVEQHQNVSESQLAAAMDEIVADVQSVSSQLAEERRRSGEMVTELKLELSVIEQHQNVSASQLAAAMDKLAADFEADVHYVSSQLVEDRWRSGEMVTELKLELSVVEQHQNVSASQLAAAMDEIVTDVHSVSSQLVEERRRSGEMVTELKLTRRGIESNRWHAWSAWSSCTWSCTAENDGRVQSRDRTRPCAEAGQCEGARKQTESRPCNAVQFAGCIKSSGYSDNYAVTYDFADQMAQATCTALKKGYVSAVRRKCSSEAPDCKDTCRSVGLDCFNSLHVYRGSPIQQRDDVAKKGLKMYRFNKCSGNFCGPNFCCCRGK